MSGLPAGICFAIKMVASRFLRSLLTTGKQSVISSLLRRSPPASGEEARKKMYSVYTNKPCCAFGVHVSQEVSTKINELHDLRHLVPDSYMDVANKRYPGEPFINGQAVPYHRKYYEEHWRSMRKKILDSYDIQSPNCGNSRV